MLGFRMLYKGNSLPRAGLLLYLGRPNLEASDVPLGDDTEIGDDTIIRWLFLLPADADIRAATGWASGVGNIFYDVVGDPIAVLASEIAAWSSINQWNVLFHLVSADTETGRLAIYAQDTPLVILNKALKVLREDQIDVSPSAFFNGMDFSLLSPAYLGGPTYVPDHLGVLRSPGANLPAVQGMRLVTTVADGAVLGPELTAPAKSGEDAENYIEVIGGGRYRFVGDGGTASMLRYSISVGRRYKIALSNVVRVAGSLKCSDTIDGGVFSSVIADFTTEYTVTGDTLLDIIRGTAGQPIDITVTISIKEVIPTYVNTDESGNPILPSTPQKTVTYNTDWTAKTFAETFDKFNISDPLKAPGWLCEPVRTNYALNSATPATHTTGTLAVGTYTLWQEGSGSIVATAGTAVGTFGTASNGAPATITITTAGTVVLTASGTNTWVQLELGEFKTSRIYTTTSPVTRAATVASFPTAGKIPVNNFAIRMIVVPRASGQDFAYLFSTSANATNFTAIYYRNTGALYARQQISGISEYASCNRAQIINNAVDIIFVKSAVGGMQLTSRKFNSSWGVFEDGAVNTTGSAKANAQIGSTYQLGSLNNSNQFTGNISLFDCIPIPSGITDPMAWTKTHWGVA